ncbi:MAG: NAD(P)-binding protein, partial [Actinomycetota bacterium]|nr:NAD(P)-binding protein [Actinomycetota bacterium]
MSSGEAGRGLVADYVVVGAGAMGMAFVDEILSHSDATVALVERRNKPGGHWNDAYPHVRLHQPSFFYGLNSAQLGSDHIDDVGPNQGLSELASGAEVLAYFDHAMQRRFLPSGRVHFFANTEYRDGVAT